MRSRRTAQEEMAAVARRRLELLGAELATIRTPTLHESFVAPFDRHHDPEGDAEGDAELRAGVGAGIRAGIRAEEVRTPRAGQPGEDPMLPRDRGASSQPSDPTDLQPTQAHWFWDDRDAAEPSDEDDSAPEAWGGRASRGRHARRGVGARGRAGGWVHDRLPPTLQGRVRLTAAHLSTVALLVAAAFAVTAWWVVRADGGTAVAPVSTWSEDEAAASASPQPLVTPVADPSAGASPSEPAVVVVDVSGKVRRPGIATLPVGSRVVDAIEAAGGVRRGVDLTTLNLARVLVDGEQIVVGVPSPGGVAAPAASDGGGSTGGADVMVNINAATQSELEELPGVGPVTAAAILQWREDNGSFTAVDELLEVSGIGEATLAEMAPFVTL